jgi:hypothetical protein
MNMIQTLASALTDAGIPATVTGQTIFAGQWSIHCTLTGNVQARNVYDSHERFGLGTCETPVEAMVANFAATLL